MAEYIEREALIQHMQECKDENAFTLMATGYAYSFIEAAPSADVVEVVHGEWVHIKDYGGGKCSGHCSVCWAPQEADNPSALKGGFRYCRWCGAKMDGDDNA